MDDKQPPDFLSQFLPDALEDALGLGDTEEPAAGQETLQAQRLRALAGAAGSGPLQTAVQEFLEGKGALHATTQAAAARGIGLSETALADLLEKTFGVAPAVSRILAGLLIKVFPATQKPAKKPRRKTKPKASTTKKKPKKAAAKPKTPAAKPKKPVAKKKPAAKKPVKKSTAKKPPARRITGVDD